MKTYLVTGGAGFIGANFIHHMLSRGEECTIINADALTYAGNLDNLSAFDNDSRHIFIKTDIRDKNAVDALFETYNFDAVVHFAAESHVDRSIEDPDVFVTTNVLGTVNLLNAARKYRGDDPDCRFIQISTDEVYGSLGETGFFTEETPISPRSPYSASKAAADLLALSYFETYNLPVIVTRCSNNYGPYQFPEKLIPLMINNVLSHKPLPVYGDGLNVRDWLFVADHARAICQVLQNGAPGEVYNIGGHNERRNIDLVKTIIKTVRETLPDTDERKNGISEDLITYVKDRKGHDRRYAIDPKKIASQLGWRPETDFDDGIKETVRWYLDNEAWVDKITSGEYKLYYEKMYSKRL